MTSKKKIFLASSSELKADREQFEIFISRKNKAWIDKGIFLELVIWEDFLDALSKTRLQDEYNQAIKTCDLFVMLFCTKVGQYTEEEFETAFGQFQATNKPFIFTYFKDAPISTGELDDNVLSLLQFKKKLSHLGHFFTVYKNIEDLQLKFGLQLEKLADNGFIALNQEENATAKTVIQQTHTGTGDIVAGNQTKIGRQVTLGANSTYQENSKD
ncbi:MAG: hypothetical protein Q8K07_21180 [Methylicorpusculum sp.]|uniref:hypothetical protein n=1 Tax=Methylicorpusculum sp. TaxID=2713644 RepID=UPI00271B389B|nr:hypothetical protein [Methylicorpusculum sp.]MDO9239888.1 hypothetical protein [Methylicorpusculum sp.]MDP2180758.1 hypothetical protein [Methylicorpusculum sp.]MDP2204538.1 hypothetical protein [Methylicorpusculum sp.]MDZ4151906.1 hypothetical protein [Methylicorpusculum sp.]